MPAGTSKSLFKQAFIQRVALARAGRRYTQAQMADLLEDGMKQDTYKQYETRSYLPHDLIPKFCLLCDIDHQWLFTGHGRSPAVSIPEEGKRRSRPKRRAA